MVVVAGAGVFYYSSDNSVRHPIPPLGLRHIQQYLEAPLAPACQVSLVNSFVLTASLHRI